MCGVWNSHNHWIEAHEWCAPHWHSGEEPTIHLTPAERSTRSRSNR